jgi:endonuclease YncB( thermonuclease family)
MQVIDAPDRHQSFGTRSTEHRSDLVAGKNVVVDYSRYDRYGSIPGIVIMYREDVKLEQTKDSMGWHFRKYRGEQSTSNRVKYSAAELQVSPQKPGLWRYPTSAPPWNYRLSDRDRRKSLEPFADYPREPN